MKFRYSGPVSIEHLNTRKTGDEDDRVLAVDVKMRATMSAAESLGRFAPELADALFTDIGAVSNLMLGPITFAHELEHYRIDSDAGRFTGCRLRKFSVTPKDGRETIVTFTASFEPTADEFARLAEDLADEIDVTIQPEDGELDLNNEGTK